MPSREPRRRRTPQPKLTLALLAAGALFPSALSAQPPETARGSDGMYAVYADTRLSPPVAGKRRIHLVCVGKGRVTVILSAGAGDWSATWRPVQPELAATTRVCAWDRAGFGFSDPSSEPQDVAHTTLDLERALKAGKIAGPYVLVGHGLGALESLLFADRHFHEVAGMVLEDPTVPGEDARLQREHPKLAAMLRAFNAETVAGLRRCLAATAPGAPPPRPGDCPLPPPQLSGPAKVAFLRRREAPGSLATEISLFSNLEADTEIAESEDRGYGGLPLVVLTAGEPQPLPPTVSREVALDYAGFIRADWPAAHAELASVSGEGQARLVPGAPHAIHEARPEAVREAVLEVLSEGAARQRPRAWWRP